MTAKVRGTKDYRVKLQADGDDINYSCSCPLGDGQEFCKHCVAVGLAWIEEVGGQSRRNGSGKKSTTIIEDVRLFLERQSKSWLIDILLDESMESDNLRERLFLEAARINPEHIDLKTYCQAIKKAISVDDFVDYYSTHAYAQDIRRMIKAIGKLLDDGFAAETIELTEYTLIHLEESLGLVDDSDGRIDSCISELQELHHRACRKAHPDPVALARKLFKWEMQSDWEIFSGALKTYADVLGQKGLKEYRRLAEAEWSRVPALQAGEDDPQQYGRRFRITSIMEALARESGDVEELINIKRRDLSQSYAYLQIAETYREAGKYDEALEWAERGWKTFPEKKDWRLGEFLADEYHRRKQHDKAVQLIWEQFIESPNLETYRKLQTHVQEIGRSSWTQWREHALAHLRAAITPQGKRARHSKPWQQWPETDRSELARIFLWEKRYEEAWQEAQAGGCTDDLWLLLAALREANYPLDALSIYREHITTLIETTDNTAYQQAIELLQKVRKLMQRLGQDAEFYEYLATLRDKYKRKRNFIKLLITIT